MDARKAFVVDTISGAIAPPAHKAAYAEHLAKDEGGAIAAFLDDPSTQLLQVSVAKRLAGQLQLRLTNSADFPPTCFYQLILTKSRHGALTDADIPTGIMISTVLGSPVSSLHHSLTNVFLPMISLEQQPGAAAGHKQHLGHQLGELLLDLQAGLGKLVRMGQLDEQGGAGQAPAAPAPGLHGILTLLDELQYWADAAASTPPGAHTKAAAQVLQHLDPLRQPLSDLRAGSLAGEWEGGLELVGRLVDALRQVWPVQVQPAGWAFSQARMQHVLQLAGCSFTGYMQRKLQGFDLWHTSFSVLKGSLVSSAQLLSSWASEAATLSGDWAVGLDAGGHLWQGPGFVDKDLAAFQDRIEQIYALRELHEELAGLFSQEEASVLGLASVLAPFAQLPALHVSAYTAPAWAAAHSEHERRLEAAEARVAQKLKELFATIILPNLDLSTSQQHAAPQPAAAAPAAVVHPQQLMQELRQYSRLLARPRLMAALHNEHLALAKQIDLYIEGLQQEFESVQDGRLAGSGVMTAKGRFMHGAADKVSQLLQCQAKASAVQDVLQLLVGAWHGSGASNLVGGIAASAASAAETAVTTRAQDSSAVAALRGCLGTTASLVKAIDDAKKTVFQDWQEDTLAQLQDMASWKTSRLMSFDAATGHIRCHFNELLVDLMREVRQLQGLGFRMRPELSTEVEVAARFHRYGMVLQQCAHFYNNIATEMIPCQKAMMLAEAVEFEKVLINPTDANGRDITWHNSVALEGYVRRLSAVAERLAASNRQLKQWHRLLAGKVAALMSTDLVRHKDRWVAAVKDMREVFSRLEAQGYPRDRQETWRQHWDFQLYKALDVQYRVGLEAINKTLPEMEVSLVVRHHALQYEPPLEELRAQHLTSHLQPFLALPLRMKGVSSLSERSGFFGAIALAYPAAVAKVYEACEALFCALADEAAKYADWLALGAGADDLEALVEQQLWGDGSGSGSAAASNGDGDGDATDTNAGAGAGAGGAPPSRPGAGAAATCDDGGLAAWELNMKMLKAAARDLERLPNEVRIDVYCVRLAPFKAYVEEMVKRLREALAASLRKKALSERDAIEDFLAAGSSLLNSRASSAEEIGRAGQEARRLVTQLTDVAQLRKRVEEKNRLLRQLACSSGAPRGAAPSASLAPVDLSSLAERWDVFVGQLQAHDAHLEAQRQGLQQLLAKRFDDFRGTVAGFASRWQGVRPRGGPSGNPSVVLVQLEDAARQLQDLQEEAEQLFQECEALSVAPPAFPQLADVAADIAGVRGSWVVYQEFLAERDGLAHRDWLSMRDQVWKIEDFLSKWEGSCTTGSAGAASMADDPGRAAIALVLLKEIDAYRQCLPQLKTCMRGVGWEDSHWCQLFALLGIKPGCLTKETVTLAHFLDKCDLVIANADAIKALDAAAQGEALISKALTELKLWALQRCFAFVASDDTRPASTTPLSAAPSTAAGSGSSGGRPSSTGGGAGVVRGGVSSVPLIRDWAPILSEVGDHQALVVSLKMSPYYAMFKDEVASWEARLSTLLEGLALLQGVQRRWLHLGPIFGRGALPTVAGRFRHVDGEFRAIMGQLKASGKVAAFAGIPRVLERLGSMASQLESCQRALNEFLEEKRGAFPRFFFLGDDDLLEVLGQGASLAVIQPHLKKLFAGIHRVRCSPDQTSITAMASSAGEVVDLPAPVAASEAIEVWLHQLTDGMRAALQASLRGLGGLAEPFVQAPAQVLGLYHALSVTERAEAAIRDGSLPKLAAALRQELAALAAADYSGHSLLQAKKQALIIDMMHSCNVVEGLLGGGGDTWGRGGRDQGSNLGTGAAGGGRGPPCSIDEWAWTRQLRYYADPDGRVVVSMAQATLDYTWEYAGNTPKLVITPLTDRCFLTLTQALSLGYGGNPYGPAGTGKTESVKALGQALGRQVLVFNCDEEFDVRAMGRIFVGLLRCGAWGCFDEFNRLGEDVLSAVSQQVQAIQAALKEGARQLVFMGKPVEVNLAAGLFVTLNPAGKGYGGRSKLPDNLQQMFRPIAMAVPDNDLIAEVVLASEGFGAARALAAKLVALYALAREGLSRQHHYDWGLRALKTALGAAGRLLRQARRATPGQGGAHDNGPEAETAVVVRAVCATKLPTLTFEDVGRFRGLIADIFPGVPLTDASNAELAAAAAQAAADLALALAPQQAERVLQLHLALEQRIGVIIMGPSGSGKSTLWQVLELALEKLGARPIVHRLNPKAMPRQQLLGSLNMDTREWTDGVLTAAARKVAAEPPTQSSWIVADGDIDPEWIESLNSVLDDNRLLTLPNGERIQFGRNINLLFECDSLAYASPATVSRCGLMYMSEAAIKPAAVLTKWLSQQQQAAAGPTCGVAGQFGQLFAAAHDLLAAQPAVVPSTRFGLLENVLPHLAAAGVGSNGQLLAALALGLGATLAPEQRRLFVTQLMRHGADTGGADPLFVPASEDPLAFLEELQNQQQLGASEQLGCGSASSLDHLDHRLMLTDEVRSVLAMLAPWLAQHQPVLLAGPEGCGKSTLLDYCFSRLPGRVAVATVQCSAQTTADNIIQKLLQACGKPVTTAQGKCLRPDTGRVILYLRNLNLPKPDKYETMQVVAFVQQLLTHGGFYDEHLDFIRVERVQVVASMVPGTSAGRSQLSRRLTARLRLAVMGYPDEQHLEAIYARMLQQAFGDSKARQAAVFISQAGNFAKCMLQVYGQLLKQAGPAPSGSSASAACMHCSFTPRDLTAWVEGLKRYDLSAVEAVDAFAAEGVAVFAGRLPEPHAAKLLEDQLLAALRGHLGYRGGLPAHLYTSLGAPQESRLACAAAGTAMPLVRRSVDEAATLAAGLLRAYEREVADTQLLLVPQALQRMAALDRCLSVPAGAVLLCGPSGSGRRSLLQLVAHAHGLRWWSPKISRSFDAAVFRADLKEVLRLAGIEGVPLLLFLEERHLASDPGVLELLNCLLAAGEVPGLFSSEELAKELAALDAKRDADSHYQGPPSNYAFFTTCLRRNLRIAVSLDPAHEAFSTRLEQSPALTSCCSVLWWQGWSSSSLQAMAAARLKSALEASGCAEDEQARLLSSLLTIHDSAMQQLGAVPRQFLSCATLCSRTLGLKQEQLQQQQRFLKGGLDRLAEAASTIDDLGRQAQAQRALLAQKQQEADQAMTNIQASMEVAAERRREVEHLRAQLGESEAALQAQRGQVEAQLAQVQPLIDAARTAVGGIKADNINEVRSLRMPSDVIRDVLEGVLLLMGQEDISWVAMKAFLGKRSVKEDILNYDAHRILTTPGLATKLDRLMAAKGGSFEKEVAYRASQAAGPMAVWVVANMHFSRVLKQIAPLESQLGGLKGQLGESQERLRQCQAELAGLDEQVVSLKAEFQQRIREAEALKLQLARAEETLTAAAELLGKLDGERGRWGGQLAELDGQLQQLPAAALLLAAFVTYLPAHPEDVREAVLPAWASHVGLPAFSPTEFMGSEPQLLTWQAQGLPRDTLSAQNAVAVLHGVQAPFVIDPSSQAIAWLTAYVKAGGQSCEVVPQHAPHFLNSLELAVRFGTVLIVSEVDRVHPVLYPLLRTDLQKQAGRLVVHVGEHVVDHNPAFKLYLVTRNGAPILTPDVAPLLTVTNFSITRSGLQSQLLSLTLQHEQPELEARKAQLLQAQASQKLQLSELEKQLLQALATSSGNLLNDTALVTSLNETKAKALTVAAALGEGRALAARLDEQRSAYQPLAVQGSLLYFSLVQLKQLDSMYCFSLSAFMGLFRQLFALPEVQAARQQQQQPPSSVAASGSSGADLPARNTLLCRKLLELVHAAAGRAMFARHHLALALHLARHLLPEQFPAHEWAVFLSCSGSLGGSAGGASPDASSSSYSSASPGPTSTLAGPLPSWVAPDTAATYAQIADSLPELVAAAQLHDARVWAPWVAASAAAAAMTVPGGLGGDNAVPAAVAGRLTGLQQLILVAAFQPESLPAATAKLMSQLLHLPSLHPAPLSMRQLVEQQHGSTGSVPAMPAAAGSAPIAGTSAPASTTSTTTTTTTSSSDGNAGFCCCCCEPVLFVLTPGADPSQELSAFAEAQPGPQRLHELAMGQGQAETALQLLRECAGTGDWLLLKNLHLASMAWLPVLERELHGLVGPAATHPGFRLFLTSQPHARFPQTLLEGSLKVVFEAPPGLKHNLQHTYAAWSTDFLAGQPGTAAAVARRSRGSDSGAGPTTTTAASPARPVPQALVPLRAQLLFLLAWFHAVVQERRSYVPIGWSTPYDFSGADLRAAADVVAAAALGSGRHGPDLQQLLGLLLVIYGGRVSSPQDAKVLLAHLVDTFEPRMLTALPGGPQQHQQRQRQPGGQRPSGLAAGLPPGRALPASGAKQEWLAFVDALPDADQPQLFGLPANIQRSLALGATRQLLASLRQLGAAQGVAAAAVDRQLWATQLQPVIKLWEQLMSTAPPSLKQQLSNWAGGGGSSMGGSSMGGSRRSTRSSLPQAGPGGTVAPAAAVAAAAAAGGGIAAAIDPVAAFVGLEREFGAALLRQVAATLGGVQAVVDGEVQLVAAAVQAAAASLLAGEVPVSWDRLWEGPASPMDYLRSVVRRASAMESWLALGEASSPQGQGGLLAATSPQQPLDLSAPFRPGALLNALAQQAARAAGVALGQLHLVACWGSSASRLTQPAGSSSGGASLAVPVAGLLLQGALFDGAGLQPVQQDSPLVSTAPPLTLVWLPPGATPPHPQTLTVPLYGSPERSRVVAELQLPLLAQPGGGSLEQQQQQWTLAGVALMLPA